MRRHLILDASELMQEMKDDIPGWKTYAEMNPQYPLNLIAAYYSDLLEESHLCMEYLLAAMMDEMFRLAVFRYLTDRSFGHSKSLGVGTEIHEFVAKHGLSDHVLILAHPFAMGSVKMIFDHPCDTDG